MKVDFQSVEMANGETSESLSIGNGREESLMTTLVIDTGQDIVGIYSVEERVYLAYRGSKIAEALERISNADAVITYNGELRDLIDLAKFARIDGDFPLRGEHIDMQVKVWAPLFGSSLERTYLRHFDDCPERPFVGTESEVIGDYELANRCDVYMTLKLWELWREDKLKIMGYGYLHHNNGGWPISV